MKKLEIIRKKGENTPVLHPFISNSFLIPENTNIPICARIHMILLLFYSITILSCSFLYLLIFSSYLLKKRDLDPVLFMFIFIFLSCSSSFLSDIEKIIYANFPNMKYSDYIQTELPFLFYRILKSYHYLYLIF